MSDTEKIQLITVVSSVVVAALTLVTAILVFFTKKAVREVHLSLNSRLSELVLSTKEKAHAEGVKDEKDAQAAKIQKLIDKVNPTEQSPKP